MALEPIVESLDSVPEAVRAEYKEVQGTGKFILDVVPKEGYALENIEGLKSALSKERGQVGELSNRLQAFGELDPQDLKQKLAKLQELETLDPVKEADKIAEAKAKSQIDQVVAKHREELGKVNGNVEKYKTQLQKLLVDDAAKAAILSAGGNEKTIAYMLPEIKRHLSLTENQDGTFITQVRDEFGNPRIGDATGSAMTVGQLVEELKGTELWAPAFPGKNKSGGGRPSDNSGGTPGGAKKKAKMSPSERSQYIKEHGLENFLKLTE